MSGLVERLAAGLGGVQTVLAQTPTPTEGIDLEEELENIAENAPQSPEEALDVVLTQLLRLWTGFLESLPIMVLGLLVLALGIMLATVAARGFRGGLERTKADPAAIGLLHRLIRLLLIVAAALFALSVVGVRIGNVVAALAVVGFAVGLAVQGILENLVAGVILLIRKPFRTGDQIITGEHEGTVDDIDFRVTKLVGYDGTVHLIPNAQVYNSTLTNLTTRGRRRTTVVIGVDYRDDHDAAREVLRQAVTGVEGVLDFPAPEVLLTELADSSVNFEVRYWTKPDIRSVRHVQDRVLSAAKRGIQEAGITIPWPIRTLVVDGPVTVDGRREGSSFRPPVTSD